MPEVVWEDGVDDEVPTPAPAPPAAASASVPQASNGDLGGGQVGVGLEARLASVDRNLDRLASAMEKLVDILSKK